MFFMLYTAIRTAIRLHLSCRSDDLAPLHIFYTITIHDIERPVAERLEVYVRREDTSYNQAVKDLLATALGVRSKPRKRIDNGLGKFRGSIDARSADALLAYVSNADFSKVESEDA